MTIAVRERTAEIGLLRAVGAARSRISGLFLAEAMLLAGVGGGAGLTAGFAIIAAVELTFPAMPARISPIYVVLSEGVALLIGLIAGLLPAHKAASLEPLEALRAE